MGSHAKFQPIEDFSSHPDTYRHYTLSVDGPIATLTLYIKEENGMRSDYELKLNSYDMGVDLELHDALERLRFEYPQARTVVVTSANPRVFCAGANIRMLATSTHGYKVNFCKYTNETRCTMEEASAESGITFIAACNGTASGGGYELALACNSIYLIDDGNAAVSLPEVPLLAVLPGTGGLTRLVDKRMVRRDLADIFCTKAEGFRTRDAKKYGLIDGGFPRSKWEAGIANVAAEAAASSPARVDVGITLHNVSPTVTESALEYDFVSVKLNHAGRRAEITIKAPTTLAPANYAALLAEGDKTWGMWMYKELDDALLRLRFNYPALGLIVFRTEGNADAVLAHDEVLHSSQGQWFADELMWFRGRVLRRVDNMSKSMFAIIDEGSCWVGSLFEITIACDRSYMLEDEDGQVSVQLNAASTGIYPMVTRMSRLQCRFAGAPDQVGTVLEEQGNAIDGPDAFDMGLVTMTLDDIDWEDEVRIAVEERVSMSPDALTGMEQNLRFVGKENCDTKIYGRLTAWQNWIFQRPNAVGDQGALTLYGFPERPRFNWDRT